jgi:hypothetical protein
MNKKHGGCPKGKMTRLYVAGTVTTHDDYDVGPHPGGGWSFDRYPDNNGDYEPTNWRWATPAQQQQNTRTTKLSEEKVVDIRRRYVRGINQSKRGNAQELAEEYGVDRTLITRVAAGRMWSVQK